MKSVNTMQERVQKVLARCGHGSRRQIEALIGGGRISVNGAVAALGDSLKSGDRVSIDGQRFRVVDNEPAQPRVLAYHKPEGEICTRRDEQGRRTVYESLPRLRCARWISVGRLDFNTSGLLLFSDDGALVDALAHPRRGIEREYAVRVRGEVVDSALASLTQGVRLDGETVSFKSLEFRGGAGSNRWYHVVLSEGRNREVRRMWEAVGASVSRLTRVRYGPLALPRSLRPGEYMDVKGPDLANLLAAAGWRGSAGDAQLSVQREKRSRRR
jgi:23S rRNA pseudouridine2605 synthase